MTQLKCKYFLVVVTFVCINMTLVVSNKLLDKATSSHQQYVVAENVTISNVVTENVTNSNVTISNVTISNIAISNVTKQKDSDIKMDIPKNSSSQNVANENVVKHDVDKLNSRPKRQSFVDDYVGGYRGRGGRIVEELALRIRELQRETARLEEELALIERGGDHLGVGGGLGYLNRGLHNHGGRF